MKSIILITIFTIQGIFYSSTHENIESNKSVMNEKYEKATLGGGCFWCIEAVYNETKGVIDAISGYSGGFVKNPAYREVTSGRTGHAEVVQITYNPDIISFEQILTIFFSVHDPTTLNRQGADIGPQYRSVIFYQNESQRETANLMITKLNQQVFKNSIVTQISPLINFYKAEEYHQRYFEKNPEVGYCSYVINPKMIKFRKEFNAFLK